jgi:hypothetical protein
MPRLCCGHISPSLSLSAPPFSMLCRHSHHQRRPLGRHNFNRILLSPSSVGVVCIEGVAVHEDVVFSLF